MGRERRCARGVGATGSSRTRSRGSWFRWIGRMRSAGGLGAAGSNPPGRARYGHQTAARTSAARHTRPRRAYRRTAAQRPTRSGPCLPAQWAGLFPDLRRPGAKQSRLPRQAQSGANSGVTFFPRSSTGVRCRASKISNFSLNLTRPACVRPSVERLGRCRRSR